MRHFRYGFLVFVLTLAACDPITLGLGLGGGYVASRELGKSKEKQERAVDRRISREQQYYQEQDSGRMEVADQQIASQMAFSMLGGGLTSVLTVTPEVRGGVVTLYGTVPSPAVADRAVSLARQTPGVKDVVSRLNIMEMHITPTGKAWGHVASAPPPPQQPVPMPYAGQGAPQGAPPEAAPPSVQQQAPPVVPYPEYQKPFAPVVQEQAQPPQGSNVSPQGSAVPVQPITPPEQVPMQQVQPQGEYMQPSGQYVQPPADLPPPQPQPEYQRPPFQEPAGTMPRTLPGVEEKK